MWLSSGGNGFSLAREAVPQTGAKCADKTLAVVTTSKKICKSSALHRSRRTTCRSGHLGLWSIGMTDIPNSRHATEILPRPQKTSRHIASAGSQEKETGNMFPCGKAMLMPQSSMRGGKEMTPGLPTVAHVWQSDFWESRNLVRGRKDGASSPAVLFIRGGRSSA